MSASEILRAHIQALPEYLRQPWTADLVDPASPTYGAVMEQQPAVEYIALLGPQVGEKLADHLATLRRCLNSDPQPCDHEESDECLEAIATTADALEAAVTPGAGVE